MAIGKGLITRRRLLCVAGAGAAAAAYPAVAEPQWFETTRTRIALRAGGGGTMRILQLTDLHASWCVPMWTIRRAIDIGLASKPDVVCLTGDFITHREDFDASAYVAALRRLTSACPTFAVLGNHDGGPWAGGIGGHWTHRVVDRMLEQAGVTVLHNRSVSFNGLHLVGVGDLWSRELEAASAFRDVSAGAPTVVLCHNPDGKEELRHLRWDLMLSGHTHGGQVRLPHDPVRYAPVRDRRFVAGLGRWEGRHIYVSRGVGSLGGIRFLCRPEITILDV